MIVGANNKRTKHVETGFDSEDNEPIGSIFKLRKPRGAKKKATFALEGTGGGGGKNADSIGKNLVAAQEDLGSMDDTLASFRKRLKGPKRGQGSGAARGRVSAPNVVVESSNVSCQYVGLDEKSSLNTDSICEGRDAGDNGSDLAVDMKTTGSCQVKVGGPNVELALKGIQGHTVSEGDLVAQGSRNALRDEKGVGVLISAGLQHSSDEIMEDSLSEVFQKAQSNFVGKSCNTLSSKQNCGSQNLKDGLSLDPKSATQTVEGICDSNISDGLLVDPCFSVNGCYRDSQQLSCVQSEDFCSPSDQKVALQERILNDSLKECSAILHDVEKIIDTVSLSKMGEGVPQFSEGELKSRLIDEQAQVCNSTSKYGDFTSMEKEKLFPCDSEPLTKSSENILNENSHMVSGSVNFETKFVSGRSCCDHNSLDTKAEVQDFVLGFLPENNCAVSGGCLYPVVSNEANKSELAAQPNHLEIPLEVHNIPKDSIAFIPECSSVLDPTQPSHNTFEEGSLPNDDCFYAMKETDDAFPQSGIPEENENYVEYAASVSEVANIDKTSSVMRRKAKKRRHGDMAYEGDADWDVLINDQVFLKARVVLMVSAFLDREQSLIRL